MSDAFDPYYSWLGIPPAQQPADYYRLLGINRFEGNQEVIANAAERQIRHIETFKTGLHAKEAEKLLDKLATAKVCLSDVGKKQVYDRVLSGTVAAENSPPVGSDSPKAHSSKVATSRSRSRTRNPLVELVKIVLGGIAGIVIAMAILWYGFGMDVFGVMQPQRDITANPLKQSNAKAQPKAESKAVKSLDESTRAKSIVPKPKSKSEVVQPQAVSPRTTNDVEPSAHWQFLRPTTLEALHGTKLSPLQDASVLASGVSAEANTYVLTATSPLTEITGFQIEALTDSSLPEVGPGRCGGNFVVTEFKVFTVGNDGEALPIALRNASASYEQKNSLGEIFSAARAIDGDEHGKYYGWSLVPGLGQPHRMVVETVTPISGSEMKLRIVLDQQHGGGHTLGRFRLAVTSSPPPQNESDPGAAAEESTENSVAAAALPSMTESFHDVMHKLQGTWEITYTNRTKQRRSVGTESPPISINGDILIDFDTVIERLTLVGDKLFVEHFNPKSTYPGGFPDAIGIGKRIDVPVELTPIDADHDLAISSAETSSTFPARAVVPSVAVLASAEATVRSVFADEYVSSKTPAEKSELAAKLLQIGLDTTDDLASRYVTLRSARNVAVEGGHVDLAFRAIDAMNESFEIDALAEQARLADDLVKASLNDEETAKFKIRIGELREQAFVRDVYPIAVRLNDLSRGLGKATDKQSRETTDRWTKRLEAGAAAFELVQEALKTLESSPDDVAANLTIGRYRCLLKSEWPIGLPYLAKGDDEKLRAIAEREMASSDPTPNETLALADSWWDLVADLGEIEKPQAQMRAAQFYELALPNLSGLSAAKADKRVRELRALGIDSNAVPPELPHRGPAPTEGASKSDFKVMSNSIGMKLVLIPAGEFMMGSPENALDANQDELPQHLVRVAEPFYMSVHEVTVEQFRQFADDSGYKTEAETDGIGGWGYNASMKDAERQPLKYSWRNTGFHQTDNSPVVNVSWNDATKFCEWLSNQPPSASVYRLPSEMEWEYACRAGTRTRYSWGDDGDSLNSRENVADISLSLMLSESRKLLNLVAYASWNDDSPFAAPVGTFSANGFGLYDMHGNVSEWCQDAYGSYRNPKKTVVAQQRVFRGGSFIYPLTHARSSQRHRFEPSERWFNLGFRVVCELDVTSPPGE